VRASKILTAASVLAVGICAAWPFRQPAGQPNYSPPASVPLDLTLRSLDVPLTASSATDQSPAVNLPPSLRALATGASTGGSVPLEQFTPAPEMPVSFRSPLEAPSASLRPFGPAAMGNVQSSASTRPRQYTLRDGDTLEKLAERFLGSRARSAEIYEANRRQLARPDLLPVGTTIMIPPRSISGGSTDVAER
jgi:nucleoid-associated protein YgaU